MFWANSSMFRRTKTILNDSAIAGVQKTVSEYVHHNYVDVCGRVLMLLRSSILYISLLLFYCYTIYTLFVRKIALLI
jgi:hypothetical protein